MNKLKSHKFWAVCMLVSAVMCFYTGYKMTKKPKVEKVEAIGI